MISDQSLLLSTTVLNDKSRLSRAQEEAGLCDEPVSYLQVALL